MKVFELVGEITVKIGEAVKNLKKTEDAAENTADELRELGDSGEKSTDKFANGLTKAGRVFENVFKKNTSIKETRTSFKELTDTVEKQESKLTELKNRYIQVYHSQGETSDEAKECASEIEKLSKSLKENKTKLTDAEKAADKFDKSLDDVGETTEQTESKMSSAFKKIGAAITAAFAIDKIKDFANACVDASAEVSAEASAFEQIMGNYSDKAYEKMKKVADGTGVIDTRLTSYMTSITAKFKGLGYGVEEATDLAADSLNLVSDAAAFWDKSLNDSVSALNSFINGSYEGGEAIGLFANDTQMASYAVKEGIVKETKEWASLNEARKQATRLEYAQAMMKASGAVGQAAKESGQYANVLANLNEKWRQFKAQIGEPILQNIVIPAMGKLTVVIDALSVGFQKASKWCSEHKMELQLIAVVAGTLATAIGAYTIAQNAAAIATTISTAATTAFGTAMAFVTSPITIIILAIGALVAAFLYFWNKSEGFRNFWIGLWGKIKEAAGTVAEWFSETWSAIVDWFLGAWDNIKEAIKGVTDWFSETWNGITTWFLEIWIGIQKTIFTAWETIKRLFSTIAQWIHDFVFQPIINFFAPVIEFFRTAFENILGFAKGCWEIIKRIWEVVSAWFNSHIIEPISKLFSEMWNGISNTAGTAWNTISSVARAAWNAIKSVWSEVSNWFNSHITGPVSRFFSEMWKGLKTGASGAWNGIKSVFSSVTNWFKEKFSAAWTAVKNVFSTGGKIFSGIKDGIVNAFKTVVNGIIKGINKVIAIPFNAINKALRTIRDVSFLGISPFKGLLKEFSVPQIPLLAKGGVLERGQVGVLEGDGAEAVVPLDQNLKWLERLKQLLAPAVTESVSALVKDSQAYNATANRNGRMTDSSSMNKPHASFNLGGITLQIDNFYNNTDKDIRELTEEMMEIIEEYIKRKGGVFA